MKPVFVILTGLSGITELLIFGWALNANIFQNDRVCQSTLGKISQILGNVGCQTAIDQYHTTIDFLIGVGIIFVVSMIAAIALPQAKH